MQIGQPNDDRKYRRLRKSDYYSVKKAADQKVKGSFDKCGICGRSLEGVRKNWGGFCIECRNDTL